MVVIGSIFNVGVAERETKYFGEDIKSFLVVCFTLFLITNSPSFHSRNLLAI